MSSRRLALSAAVMAIVVVAGSWGVVRIFPMTVALAASAAEPPQVAGRPADQAGTLESRANPVTPENPIPRRLASAAPPYPAQFRGSGLRAQVRVRITLDPAGSVAEARVTSSSGTGSNIGISAEQQAVFAASALDAVRRWLYAPPANPPIAFDVMFDFNADAAELISHGGEVARVDTALERARALARAAELRRAATALGSPSSSSQPGTVTAPEPLPAPRTPIRVGGAIAPPIQTRRMNPVYPAIAINARVQGVVILELQVGVDGQVSEARVLRSIPLLDQAAVDAVRQWQYVPTLLNGEPVPVTMTVTVQFLLPQPEAVPEPAN